MYSKLAAWLTAGLLLISGQAAATDSYWYAGVGVGLNLSLTTTEFSWHDEGEELGCGLKVGYRDQIAEAWWIDANVSHYSQCFVGQPFNSDNEMAAEFFYIWVEYRW